MQLLDASKLLGFRIAGASGTSALGAKMGAKEGAKIVKAPDAPALDPSRLLGFRLGGSDAVTGSKMGDKVGTKTISGGSGDDVLI
jgi:hypothetical protein